MAIRDGRRCGQRSAMAPGRLQHCGSQRKPWIHLRTDRRSCFKSHKLVLDQHLKLSFLCPLFKNHAFLVPPLISFLLIV